MPIQSLGIFDSVFDWVCDKLFDPIIEWLSKILNSIFEWLLNNIVIPLLMPVFEFLWNIIIANIADIFYSFIYGGYCQWLWILDQLQSGFDILIGMKDVTYYSESLGRKDQTTLLQYFMNNEIIRNALISITFVALALSMIFSIYSVMRSTLDFDFEGKRPVGKVLNSVAKSMIAFLLVPTICVFGISLASIVLKQTCAAISGNDASLGRWVLAISSMDAGRGNPPTPFINASTNQIAEPWASLIDGSLDYVSFGTRIHISQIDYILGFASLIFMAVVMIICLFTFIKRIFDIILLYITSPYFVSTIVLDDGEKFKRWRDMFIAKILVGFGSVIGLRIFLMMIPVIMNDQLEIFDSVAGNITGGYVIRLVFILGGMYAVYKSSTLLTGIISSSVASEENMNNALMAGLVGGGAKKGMKALAGVGKNAFSQMRSKKSSFGGSAANDKKTKSARFTGGAGSFSPVDYSKSFKSDFAGSLGLKEDQIKDDYISQDILDKEREMAEGKELDPLSRVDGLDGFTLRDDYSSDPDETDFTGNADLDGIRSFGEAGSYDEPYDKLEIVNNALRKNGEQGADSSFSKAQEPRLNSDTLNNERISEKPRLNSEMLNNERIFEKPRLNSDILNNANNEADNELSEEGDNRFDSSDYTSGFGSEFTEPSRRLDNLIHDDDMSDSNLDDKHLKKLFRNMDAFGDIGNMKNFNFGGDSAFDIFGKERNDLFTKDADSSGNTFGGNDLQEPPAPDDYVMSDDAVRRYDEADEGTTEFNGNIRDVQDNVMNNDHGIPESNRDILERLSRQESTRRDQDMKFSGGYDGFTAGNNSEPASVKDSGSAARKHISTGNPEIVKPADPLSAAKRSDHKNDSAKF